MEHLVEFWQQLGYNKIFLISLLVFFLAHLSLLIYRTVLLAGRRKLPEKGEEDGVSVIITCANQAELIRENLEYFLNQEYPVYEVIVVDECSEDDTQAVLSALQKEYPQLKTSRIFPGTKFRKTKKLAINLGVLAARYDILLFSEISCRPAGRNWIRSMQSFFDEGTAVVVGRANYGERNSLLDFRRYFRFLWFWEAAFLVRSGMYYAGNGCNMGYRKRYYLESRGFGGNTQEYIGYDTDMVHALSRYGKVRMAVGTESMVRIEEGSPKAWRDDHSYAYASRTRFPGRVNCWGHSDFLLETCLYLNLFYFLLAGTCPILFLSLLLAVWLIDLLAVNICMKRIGLKKLFLTSTVAMTFGFIYKVHYTLYACLTRSKWR